MRMRAQRGFTLLEILVALAVLALAMGAVINAVSDYTGTVSHLRDRTFANWVARNVLNDYQARIEWPRVGEIKGSTEMGSQEWDWVARVSQTDEGELRRMDVEVMLADDDDEAVLTTLSGFLRHPG